MYTYTYTYTYTGEITPMIVTINDEPYWSGNLAYSKVSLSSEEEGEQGKQVAEQQSRNSGQNAGEALLGTAAVARSTIIQVRREPSLLQLVKKG